MSPEERQLLVGLFERTKGAAAGPRDQEAEAFINDQVKAQPAAPYLLAQTVIVQEEALRGANARIEELSREVRELESKPAGGFLGGLFGGGPRQAPPQPRPFPGGAPGGPMGGQPMGGPTSGPWGQQPPMPPQGYAAPQAGMESGGFLKGALGTAAGVAGGVLLADGIRSLFSHGGGYGGMANLGIGSGFTPTGGDTIINNYYGDEPGGQDQGYDASYEGQDGGQDSGGFSDADYDSGYDDGGFDSGGDGGFDT